MCKTALKPSRLRTDTLMHLMQFLVFNLLLRSIYAPKFANWSQIIIKNEFCNHLELWNYIKIIFQGIPSLSLSTTHLPLIMKNQYKIEFCDFETSIAATSIMMIYTNESSDNFIITVISDTNKTKNLQIESVVTG